MTTLIRGEADQAEIESDVPHQVRALIDAPALPVRETIRHAWNPEDRSKNILVIQKFPLSILRLPTPQSTDGVRGKVCYERGLHVFEVHWPEEERGTHPVVGVCTAEAPLQGEGYLNLIGSNQFSWGWNLSSLKLIHNSQNTDSSLNDASFGLGNDQSAVYYPPGVNRRDFIVPERFYMILNLNEGTVGFVVNNRYLGAAFRGLAGKKVFFAVSSVWGKGIVHMRYVGGLESGVLPLVDACRDVIIASLGERANDVDAIATLGLPVLLQEYMRRDENKWGNIDIIRKVKVYS